MNNKKKKIGFVIGALSSGGAERVISSLSNELIDRYDIIIITFVKSTPFYTLNKKIKVLYCQETITTPKSIYQSIKLNYYLTRQIFKILKKEKVNIAIGFITSANILTTIASKLRGIPCIISERNNPMIEDVPKFWVILRKYVYPLADKVILQTEGVKMFYKDKLKEKQIVILPNPISSRLSNFRDSTIERKNIILSVGRLNKSKCHDILLKAFHSINNDNWEILIIGYGSEENKLKNYINSNNLTSKVKIQSKVTNIEDYYNMASIFAFTSKNEGFPNALLEAMHFGLPCISTDCNFGPSELITNNENGYLISMNPETQVAELTEKLSKLMSNSELRSQFSTKSKSISENYTTEKVIVKWEKVINSLL